MFQKQHFDRNIILYLVVITINLLSITMGNLFVNLFLLKISEDASNVLLFNVGTYALLLVAALFLGPLSKRVSKKIGIILGNACSILLYCIVIFMQEEVAALVLPLSLLSGIAQGFYWLSVNTLSLELSTTQNRKSFLAVSGLLSSGTQMIGPILASMIVGLFNELTGYIFLFSVISILMGVSIFCCLFIKTQKSDIQYSLKKVFAFQGMHEYRKYCVLFAQTFFRDGIILYLLNIFIFDAFQSEQLLSYVIAFMTLLSILTYTLVPKIKIKSDKLFRGCVYVSFFAMLLLITQLKSFVIMMIFISLFGIYSVMTSYLLTLQAQNIARVIDQENHYCLELTIIKEAYIGLGRISATILVYFLYIQHRNFSNIAIFIIISAMINLYSLRTLKRKKVH